MFNFYLDCLKELENDEECIIIFSFYNKIIYIYIYIYIFFAYYSVS